MIGRLERVVGIGEVGRSVGCSGDQARYRSIVIGGPKRVVGNGEVRVVGWGSGGSSARA